MTDTDNSDLPDLQNGIEHTRLKRNQPFKGVVGDKEVLLIRTEDSVFAVGAYCPHKGAPLEDGLVVNQTIRCQWHHASFDMEANGRPAAPAMDYLPCWSVEQIDGKIFVSASAAQTGTDASTSTAQASVETNGAGMVIAGAGAAGQAAAETLRRDGYTGSIHLISASDHLPIDRTVLSKGFLSGDQSAADIELRDEAFYESHDIQLLTETSVVGIDAENSSLTLSNNDVLPYNKLLLAMGSSPRTLPIDGAEGKHVHTLRHLADAQQLLESLDSPAEHVVIVGSGFIALEAAAALRERDIDVRIITSDKLPMQALVGDVMADFIRSKHEAEGVTFVFDDKLTKINAESVETEKGERFSADLVLLAVGVEPETDLVEDIKNVTVDDGILVDENLLTSGKNIFAAGDLAQWPYYGGMEKQWVRIEHWAVAQRQGQIVARNMLGDKTPYRTVPFFWSKQFDFNIRYSGYAEDWDTFEVDGSIEEESFSIRYLTGTLAIAMLSVNRDQQNLEFEAMLEQRIVEKTG